METSSLTVPQPVIMQVAKATAASGAESGAESDGSTAPAGNESAAAGPLDDHELSDGDLTHVNGGLRQPCSEMILDDPSLFLKSLWPLPEGTPSSASSTIGVSAPASQRAA
jgi:hypothetical protein